MLLKTWFLLLYLFSNADELDFILFSWFHNNTQLPENLNLTVIKCDEYKLLGSNWCILDLLVLAFDLSDIGFLGRDSDLLEAVIVSFPVDILLVSQSLKGDFKTYFEDVL